MGQPAHKLQNYNERVCTDCESLTGRVIHTLPTTQEAKAGDFCEFEAERVPGQSKMHRETMI